MSLKMKNRAIAEKANSSLDTSKISLLFFNSKCEKQSNSTPSTNIHEIAAFDCIIVCPFQVLPDSFTKGINYLPRWKI